MSSVRIGFPLAAPDSWEFVIVESTNLNRSLHGWLNEDVDQFRPAGFIHYVGAGRVLEFNRILTTKRSFKFYHASKKTLVGRPTPWAGHSDTAASLLALAQSTVSKDSPVVLVSCECDFSPEADFQGARLSSVSISSKEDENRAALLQKWAAAMQSAVPVMALVLFHTDAELLADSLFSIGTSIRLVQLKDFSTRDLLAQPGQWPVLVSVRDGDLPLLASKLGIDSRIFQASHNKEGERAPAEGHSISSSRDSSASPIIRLQPPEAQYDRSWYISRPLEEREALEKLNTPGIPAILWGPEKFGKTWLQSFLRDSIREQDPDSTIIPINLWAFDSFSLSSLENFIQAIANHLIDAIGGSEQWLAEIFGGFGSPNLKLTRLIERRILPAVPGRLILAIDRADAVYGSPFQDDFFSLLRSWAENSREPWPRLRLLLAVSTPPAELSQRITVSPFNLAPPVQMRDLSPAQVQNVARLHRVAWGDSEVERAMHLVGGHPYLIRLLIHRAASETVPLEGMLDEHHPSGSVFDHYLERCRSRLEKEPPLYEALRRLAKGQAGPADAPALPKLQSMGLVIPARRHHHLRYPLYQRLV